MFSLPYHINLNLHIAELIMETFLYLI